MNGTNSTGDATGQARVGWVSPPNAGRSSWGIIWSCLAIFLLCSRKCTHLNIPSVEESEAGWRKIWYIPVFPEKPLLRKWGRKLFFMGLIAIAPEVVVALATKQYMQARQSLQSANESHDNRGKYTLAHAMFAQMGGYVVHYYDDSSTQDQEAEAEPKSQQRYAYTVAGTPVANKTIDTRSEALWNAIQNGNWKPSTAQFLSLSQVAQFEKHGILFNLEEEDINDRSKADPFTKAFALMLAGWLVLQSCARKNAGLQITELELMTMAFTVCALVTYVLWWHKPFDAERSAVVFLPVSRYRAVERMLGYFWSRSKDFTIFRKTRHSNDLDWETVVDLADINYNRNGDLPKLVSSLTLCVFGAVFLAIHFAAWNWSFPLPIIQTLWQSFCCAALGSAILPPVLIFILLDILPYERWIHSIGVTLLFALLGINIISRLALIGLTFYCFTSMPASTYQNLDGPLFLPHFS